MALPHKDLATIMKRTFWDQLTFDALNHSYKLSEQCFPFRIIYLIARWIRFRYFLWPCEWYTVKYALLDHYKNGLPCYPQRWFLADPDYMRLRWQSSTEEYQYEIQKRREENAKKKKKDDDEDEEFE